MKSLSARRRVFAFAALTCAAAWIVTGCGGIFGTPFPPGTYTGDVPCTIRVVDPSGTAAEEPFTAPTTVTIDADGRFTINGDELTVGGEVLRSIPTADSAFEIAEITGERQALTVVYDPHPSLVGITVEGELVETYRWHAGSILASARADLLVTDASGTSTFTVQCDGTLVAE